MFTYLRTLFFIHLLTLTDTQLVASTKNKNYLRIDLCAGGSPIEVLRVRSRIECSAACSTEDGCSSYNFYKASGRCELFTRPQTVWNNVAGCDHSEARCFINGVEYVNQKPINCQARRSQDCGDVQKMGYEGNGIYVIYVTTNNAGGLVVYCDMTTAGGGWLVFQRRINGSVDFYRNWASYAAGFGSPESEFWIGNDNLYRILAQKNYRLRVDLTDFLQLNASAMYDNFVVGSAATKYTLGFSAFVGGNASDALTCPGGGVNTENGMMFTTFDQDNDGYIGNCATFNHGAWWYSNCGCAALNSVYTTNRNYCAYDMMVWTSWDLKLSCWARPMKTSELKFRPMV